MALSEDPADFLPWVEKYRPSGLDDVISHGDIISTIKRYVEKGQLPHLLFHGPPGTGKTSTILAVARHLYGPNHKSNVLELNASDDRGINAVREHIKTFAEMSSGGPFATPPQLLESPGLRSNGGAATPLSYAAKEPHTRPAFGGVATKLVILDEADQMTTAAQNALRRIMEMHAKNVRFCLICNHVNKITPAIQSRCTRFRFASLKDEFVKAKTLEIAAQEKVDLTDSGIRALLQIGKGDFRRVLNCLQAAALSNPGLAMDETVVFLTLGVALPSEVSKSFSLLLEKQFEEAYTSLQTLLTENGYSTQDFTTALYEEALKLDWPETVIITLLTRLADIEERLAAGADETIQLAALVSAFVEARCSMQEIRFTLKYPKAS